MTGLHLSNRLRALAEWVPTGAKLADVGTDHAYLPVWLLCRGVLDAAIVTDLRQGPLDHARKTGNQYGVAQKMDFRLCDGLSMVRSDEVDTVVIAGMGGETIASILSDAPWSANGTRLLLQPQSTQNVLRRFLQQNGYTIVEEQIVLEQGKYYTALLAKGGDMPPLSPAEEFAGRQASWRSQPERVSYLAYLRDRISFQLEGVSASSKPEDAQRRACLEQALEELERWLREKISFSGV